MTTTADTKYALVTGASSGIGKATAKELAARGFKVFACARRVEMMEDLIKYDIEPIALDVTDQEQVSVVKGIISEKTGGRLDLLFNNAGQSLTLPALDVTDAQVEQCYKVNVFAPVRLTREFAPLLIKSKGCVAFTGSLAGILPFPIGSIYASTKAALHIYVKILHMEMKPFDVKVLNIVTGGVDTNIADTRPLPDNSFYNCPEFMKAFDFRQKMAKKSNPMPVDVYAKKVVNDILSSSDQIEVYRGSKVSIMTTIKALVPWKIAEYFIISSFHLWKPFQVIRDRFSKKEHID